MSRQNPDGTYTLTSAATIRVTFRSREHERTYRTNPDDYLQLAVYSFNRLHFMAPLWSWNFRVERTGELIEHHDTDQSYTELGIQDGDVLVQCAVYWIA